MLRLARECRRGERDGLTVVDDQVGTPTWAAWIARATADIVQAVQQRRAGTGDAEALGGCYHLVGRGQTSWYGFARAILAQYGFEDVAVEPVGSDAYPRPAPRPAYSVLDPGKAAETFGLDLPSWSAQLARCRQKHPDLASDLAAEGG
jgi:dTDP-4-dehydrorhamnose reductase